MNTRTFLSSALSLFLAFSAYAGQQEEIEKALSLYGDETRKIMGDTEAALAKGIPEVEDYFKNPGTSPKPQGSFFGFRETQNSPPPSPPSKSCQTCRVHSVEDLGKPSREEEKPSPQRGSALKPSSKEGIVFVSLGLPDAVLQQLALEAAQNKSRLVIRGLLNNSFKETQARLEALKISVEIDPTLFDLFEVKRVPTFVRCKKSAQGFLKEGHDRLEGNVPLSYALEKFREKGERS